MTTSEYLALSIKEIQGPELHSAYAGRTVVTRGVVTGLIRRGFFIQTPAVSWDQASSDGVFVYSPKWKAELGSLIEVHGKVLDYTKHETAKPVTQIHLDTSRVLKNANHVDTSLQVEPINFSQQLLAKPAHELAVLLNSMEGMLVRIPAGQTFIAPSNPHGDYVLAMDFPQMDTSVLRSAIGGVVTSHQDELRWFPGFRVTNYNFAPRVNVGAKLLTEICAPLNYRADSYQLALGHQIEIDQSYISLAQSAIKASAGKITIMTLNCFNLDPVVEAEDAVDNPRQDIDDDWGDGKFHSLARAVVLQANCPDIVALQEIQDNDGAQRSNVVSAADTYHLLITAIAQLCDIEYQWVNIDPKLNQDGGQPGGNIRNGFLFNPQRVQVEHDSVKLIEENNPCFENSRKPLMATFIEKETSKKLHCINVHLASKRHQASIFAPVDPGVDSKLSIRVEQAKSISIEIEALAKLRQTYYVTGDFNDGQHSETLSELCSSHSENLVFQLKEEERYDYNHRGKLQVLMHGIVSKDTAAKKCDYEIIHGNELIGVKAGEQGDKGSDHAYVIASIPIV